MRLQCLLHILINKKRGHGQLETEQFVEITKLKLIANYHINIMGDKLLLNSGAKFQR